MADTREKRRRSVDADVIFQGQALSNEYLPSLYTKGETELWRRTRWRVNAALGLRRKTETVELSATWKRRHPEAADWVVKVLPERRTLERDLIASTGSVDPTYDRMPLGFLDRDRDHAAECKNYMNTWREANVPQSTFAEKAIEDGPFGVVVVPSDVDMDGCPDFYDRLSKAAYDDLDDDKKSEYSEDEDDPKGRYVKRNEDGSKKKSYDKDEDHQKAVQRYLLRQEQGAASIRVVPANDCVPYLVRGTGRERWKLFALIERTLYYPEELLSNGYGWDGMGDVALIPKGFDPTRSSGQNGMFYLYTLYMVWTDPEDRVKGRRPIERPIIAYSVAGNPTWKGPTPEKGKQLPDSGVAIIDLYETHGLEGPFWWFGGGLHTSDDDYDYYWEPYLWPLRETIMTIEGMSTSINAATAVNAFTGYYHIPDPAILGLEDVDASEALMEADGQTMRVPEVPAAGEIKTAIGKIIPATPAMVSPDAWKVVQAEMASLAQNTILEQGGSGGQASGHAMVVKETIAATSKRHAREAVASATRFCGERVMRIFESAEKHHNVQWPVQTTKERPVGAEVREAGDTLAWNSEWVGEGEYQLPTAYPEEYNPVKVETAMGAADRGYGTPEDVWDAMGVTDHETQWAKILKWQVRKSAPYIEARATQLAKRQGDRLMLQVLQLQKDGQMSRTGVPGFEQGVPMSSAPTPGSGGPTTAQRSLGGQMAAATGPAMQSAQGAAQVAGPAVSAA